MSGDSSTPPPPVPAIYANSIPLGADIRGRRTDCGMSGDSSTPPPPVPAIYANSIPRGADITEVGELTVS